jgi:Second Messenger Oligonucleotide or Dinucleotide Synthetase domain
MATLTTYFKGALGNIEPGDDATNAKDAHEQVSKALRSDSWLTGLGVNPVLIGSYGRDVSIRRVKDVDVFARLENADSTLRPGNVLDRMEEVLGDEFPGRVERQHRSLKVDFPDYDLSVDVVAARPFSDHWEIPEEIKEDGNATWVETNPTKMTELKEQANKEFLLYDADSTSGIYVPVVKLVRQVRRTWVDDQPGGYFFEVLTYWAFQEAKPNKDSVAAYLTIILETIVELLPGVIEDGLADPTLDDQFIKTKATSSQLEAAAERITEAAELARTALDEPDKCQAAVMWRQLLGTTKNTETEEQVFPLPDYCNDDGSTKKARSITAGAPAVPAGSDRYA